MSWGMEDEELDDSEPEIERFEPFEEGNTLKTFL